MSSFLPYANFAVVAWAPWLWTSAEAHSVVEVVPRAYFDGLNEAFLVSGHPTLDSISYCLVIPNCYCSGAHDYSVMVVLARDVVWAMVEP